MRSGACALPPGGTQSGPGGRLRRALAVLLVLAGALAAAQAIGAEGELEVRPLQSY